MKNFYKYLIIILGCISLIIFFDTLFNDPKDEIYTIFRFEVTKTTYLIYKFVIGTILIIAAIGEIKRENKIS